MNLSRLSLSHALLFFVGFSCASCSEKTGSKTDTPLAAPQKISENTSTLQPLSTPKILVVDGAQNGLIAREVGRMLEKYHYSRQPLDDAMSQKFLQRYLELLDYNHLFFIQPDIDEFTRQYGPQLDDLIKAGDASPAFVIFQRLLERVEQRGELAAKILKEKIEFVADESYTPNRHLEAWPKDDREAEQLWRYRVKDDLLQGRLNKEKPEDTIGKISRRYARFVKNTRTMDQRKVLDTYLSALSQSYDPHSDYLDPDAAKEFETEIFKQSFSGIGAELTTDDGYAKIVRLVPGGPADLDKRLKPGDRIIAVGQEGGEPVDVIDMTLPNVVKLIRGEKGTKVSLTIIPASATDTSVRTLIQLKRGEVKVTYSLAQGQIIDHKDAKGYITRVGIITLPEFYSGATRDTRRLIEYMTDQGINGLVLDFRRNPGGLLPEATRLAGLFIKKGVVTQVKGYLANDEVDGDDRTAYDGPLVVLVSRWSASASEIVAAALQDYNRALIIGGQSTHGKGTVQKLDELNSSGQIKITVQKFYRVSGGSTQFKGVIPDLILPSILDASKDAGESSLPNALPYDEVAPVAHDNYNLVAPYLSTLKKRSSERIAKNQDFQYLQQDIEFFKKMQDEKSVSLQEAKRQKETQALQARITSRDQERASRVPSADRIWQMTLDNLDKKEPPTETTKSSDPEPTEIENLDLETAPGKKPPKNQPKIDVLLQESINVVADYVDLWNNGKPKVLSTKAPVAAN